MTPLIDETYGALLLGGFCAAVCVPVLLMPVDVKRCPNGSLSGIVVVQTFLYIKLFPQDTARVKGIVSLFRWSARTT